MPRTQPPGVRWFAVRLLVVTVAGAITLAVAPLGAQPFEFKEYGVAIDMPQGMGWQPYKSSIHVDGLVELVTAGNSSNVITLFVADGGTDTAYTSTESLQRLLQRAKLTDVASMAEITVSGFPALQQDHRSSGMDITVGSRTIAVAAGRRAYVLMIIASRKDIESNPDIAATVASLRIAGGGLRLNLLPLALGGAGLVLTLLVVRVIRRRRAAAAAAMNAHEQESLLDEP